MLVNTFAKRKAQQKEPVLVPVLHVRVDFVMKPVKIL